MQVIWLRCSCACCSLSTKKEEGQKKKHHKGIVSLTVSLAGYANSEKWCEIRG